MFRHAFALCVGALFGAGGVLAAAPASPTQPAPSVTSATSAEATIRRTLEKRLPNLPHIDEITRSPMAGLWEVRLGSQVIYSDAQGSFVIEGELIDTEKHTNLTQARLDALTAVDFAKLPLRDAVVWKKGTGARKLVVFADPNCGYCKKFERELNGVSNVTVYTFLIPILGGDSPQKARDIWCSGDQGRVWRNWMIDDRAPPAAPAKCDISALSRNVALGQKHGVTGTPSLVFEDSQRVPGILSVEELEKKFATVGRHKT